MAEVQPLEVEVGEKELVLVEANPTESGMELKAKLVLEVEQVEVVESELEK